MRDALDYSLGLFVGIVLIALSGAISGCAEIKSEVDTSPEACYASARIHAQEQGLDEKLLKRAEEECRGLGWHDCEITGYTTNAKTGCNKPHSAIWIRCTDKARKRKCGIQVT